MDCLVKFDYTAQGPDQLTIKEGDTIYNAEIFFDGWFKGTLKGKTGLVPEKYLKLRTCSLTPELLSTLEFCVHQDYIAKNQGELTIHKGDIIGNVQTSSNSWNKGTLIHEQKLFPDNFVKLNVDELSQNAFQHMEFLVNFEFTAEKPEQLTLTKGNIISNVQYVRKGWNRGTLKQKFGMIPDNFVKINTDNVSAETLAFLEFVVIQDYTSKKPEELTIRKGDIIRNVMKIFNGWNKGNLRGKVGLFPDNFVKIRNPSAEDICGLEFIVTSDYTPSDTKGTDYLTIRKGESITKVQPVNDGWYKGTIIGRTGMFPDNFVKIWNANSELLKNKEFVVTSNYTSHDSEKMSLEQGDIICNVDFVSDGWYKGTKVGKNGLFPQTFVTLCYLKVPASSLATFEFEVRSNYISQTSDKLSLTKGDTVNNVQCSTNGWLKGTVSDKTGICPSNFVEIIRTPPNVETQILQDVQRLTIGETDIPEELLCPVCLELPENEIYQCKHGHTLCGTCIRSISNCPQCRISMKVDGILIRNRLAESLVCTFKARLN